MFRRSAIPTTQRLQASDLRLIRLAKSKLDLSSIRPHEHRLSSTHPALHGSDTYCPRETSVVPATIAHMIPPRILIERFENGAQSETSSQLADGLRDGIIVQLAKFKDNIIITDQTAIAGSQLTRPVMRCREVPRLRKVGSAIEFAFSAEQTEQLCGLAIDW